MSAFPIASSESLNVAQGRRLKFFFAGDSLLHEPEHDWQVNIYLGHEEEMLKRVRQASEENDVVIVAMHWGLEYTHEVHEEQRKLARRLAKAGATIIVGSHSHVVAPFEWIDGVPVFYSMGNLISSQIGGLFSVSSSIFCT